MSLFKRGRGDPGEVSPGFDPASCFCGCGLAVAEHLQMANRTAAELQFELEAWQETERLHYGREVEITPLDTKSDAGLREWERVATPEAERPNASSSDGLRLHMRSSVHFLREAIHEGVTPDDSDARYWRRDARTLRRKYYAS